MEAEEQGGGVLGSWWWALGFFPCSWTKAHCEGGGLEMWCSWGPGGGWLCLSLAWGQASQSAQMVKLNSQKQTQCLLCTHGILI